MKVLVLLVLVTAHVIQGQSSRDKLMSVADDFQKWRMKETPELSTSRGLYDYNDKMTSYDFNRYSEYKTVVDGHYNRLMAIPEDDLTRADRMTYRMLKSHLEVWRENYQWRDYKNLNPISFLEGIQRDVLRFPSNVPMKTRGDVENYLNRLKNWPKQVDEIKASLRRASDTGTANHNVSMNRLPEAFAKLFSYDDVTDTAAYKPIADHVATNMLDYNNTEKQEVLNRAQQYITNLFTSLRELDRFLREDFVPRPQYGVKSFPRGEEFYRAVVKWYLALDLTPKEIHDMGLAEVDRISKLMRAIMTKQGVNSTTSIKDYFSSLLEKPGFTYDTEAEVVEGYRKQIKEVDAVLGTLFHKLPGLPLVVKPMENDGPTATYDRGTADGSKPGTFWANAIRPKDILKMGMMALTLHEGVPGHHLQISIAMTSSMPAFRRSIVYDGYYAAPVGFPSFNAFSEGWGLYAESLGEYVGLYKDDYELMGRYSSEIFRACRLVVDTGIHYFGWDREQAVEYMLNYTANTRTTIETEIDRYITWPGQALTYKVGELKLLELREKAKKKLGDNFDIRDFHRVLLENGRMPLNLIEDNVDYWLDNFTPETPPNPPTCAASPSSPGGRARAFLLCLLTLVPAFINKLLA